QEGRSQNPGRPPSVGWLPVAERPPNLRLMRSVVRKWRSVGTRLSSFWSSVLDGVSRDRVLRRERGADGASRLIRSKVRHHAPEQGQVVVTNIDRPSLSSVDRKEIS